LDTGTEALAATDAPSVDTTAADGAISGAEFGTEPAASASGVDAPPAAPQTFTIKVGNEEQQVTLEDLQSGYLRQADYTRKTQDLAAQRQRLAQAEAIAAALERDPQGTLQALQEAYGTTQLGTQAAAEEEPLDPWEQKVVELERTVNAQRMAAQQAQIESELAQLKQTYGDFDDVELFSFAVNNGISDLSQAYKAWQFEPAVSAAQQAALQRAQEEAAAQAAAKQALTAVEGGAHRTGVQGGTGQTNSIREAFAEAKRQLGLS
jgi:hypothetical protein